MINPSRSQQKAAHNSYTPTLNAKLHCHSFARSAPKNAAKCPATKTASKVEANIWQVRNPGCQSLHIPPGCQLSPLVPLMSCFLCFLPRGWGARTGRRNTPCHLPQHKVGSVSRFTCCSHTNGNFETNTTLESLEKTGTFNKTAYSYTGLWRALVAIATRIDGPVWLTQRTVHDRLPAIMLFAW